MPVNSLLVHCSVCLALLLSCGCRERSTSQTGSTVETAANASNSPDASEDAQNVNVQGHAADGAIREFCGNCHVFPRPDSFPKSMWYEEVRQGFNFYYESGRSDLKPPKQADVINYFREHAPEELPVASQIESSDSPLKFRMSEILMPAGDLKSAASISFVDIRPGQAAGQLDLWLSDMKSGMAVQLQNIGSIAASEQVSTVGEVRFSYPLVSRNPAAVRRADLDGNGVDDLLITDLGSYLPEDHDRGKVVWIPDGVSTTAGSPITIIDRIGRVSEVQTGDFNGDGRLDVVVGEFGWHKTGGLHLLTNQAAEDGKPTFKAMILDDRSGTIHAIPTDVNGDGRLDIVSVISQEHEKIVAFINLETGFEKVDVHEAPDPSWGSSGIFLSDMDNDGDTDILYTNGDSFDSHVVKPYHGVWWLENQGSMPFTPHRVADLPGVHRAIAADLDGDGDVDIVAAAMLPEASLHGYKVEELHAIIWLEKIPSGDFVRHVVERGLPNYAAMSIGDLNQDNRPDIVVGIFKGDTPELSSVARIFWNEKSSN